MRLRPSKHSRWNPYKRRSNKQKAHLASLNGSLQGSDENSNPTTGSTTSRCQKTSQHSGHPDQTLLLDQLNVFQERASTYERQYRNERKKCVRREKTVESLKEQCSALTASCSASLSQLEKLEIRHSAISKKNHALMMRWKRASTTASLKRAVAEAKEISTTKPSAFEMKDRGTITNASRSMVRDLVATLDVPISSVNGVIQTVATTLGVDVKGSTSSRSIRRIIGEAGVAAEAQLVDEISQTEGITLSGDGTTHKNINYQSHHITYTLPSGAVATRFAGIRHEVNHTSETQLGGWQSTASSMYDTYNSVRSSQKTADAREFPVKAKGMITDHAEDQRKLVRLFEGWKRATEREVRGERALSTFPPAVLLPHLGTMTDKLMASAGGPAAWDVLPPEKRQVLANAAICELRMAVGELVFSQLSEAEKGAVDFFVWAGCCMHKELNAVKGGNSRMRAWWEENKVTGPVLLMNKDNSAAAAGGASSAKERAISVSTGGAQKVLDLAGAVFRHKDDKKGQQDSLHYNMEAELGFVVQWPDTSNTRYHSHGDAACEFLVHAPCYITYLELMRLKKDKRTLTNIEENVLRGFTCTKTKEEIICFAVYNQCITHPYLRLVRRSSLNILDLGSLHSKLISHLSTLITNVDTILGPGAEYKTATLDGKLFERPEAVYAIQRLASDTLTYPHLHRLLKAFLEGAKETWIRFTSEFVPGGLIDRSSASDRRSAFMRTTNDVNEGALGTVRTSFRRAPHMSLSHFNSRFMYKKNATGSYIANVLGDEEQKNLRKKAREKDQHGDERIRRKEQAKYDKELAEKNRELDAQRKERKEAAEAKLASVVPRTTPEALESMRVAEIDLQLRWHRQFDSQIPKTKDIPKTKAEKLDVLKVAVGRYLRGETAQRELSSATSMNAGGGREEEDDEDE